MSLNPPQIHTPSYFNNGKPASGYFGHEFSQQQQQQQGQQAQQPAQQMAHQLPQQHQLQHQQVRNDGSYEDFTNFTSIPGLNLNFNDNTHNSNSSNVVNSSGTTNSSGSTTNSTTNDAASVTKDVSSIPTPQHVMHQHEEEEEVVEQPFYVNAKQYHRILKRRIARAKLEESLKVARGRKPYLHESRHKHAMRRPRGQGGRFLTAAEIAERERLEKANSLNGGDASAGAADDGSANANSSNNQAEETTTTSSGDNINIEK